MNKLKLFTDGSVNTKSKIGYGAYLFISEYDVSVHSLQKHVQVKQFEETSSTKLELQTLLWALDEIVTGENKVTIYTDSQNIVSLLERRERLEENKYSSKKNKLIKNHQLYKEFYKISDKINLEIIKVQGHKKSSQKGEIDQYFTLVDRASRNALRKDNSKDKKFICQ